MKDDDITCPCCRVLESETWFCKECFIKLKNQISTLKKENEELKSQDCGKCYEKEIHIDYPIKIAVQQALSKLREFVGKTMSKNPMTKEEVGWNYACLRITEHIDKAIDSRRTA
jgi:hypothetical protein